jgi:hypothetical protein
MANKIKGNQDGTGGRNETYTIPGRGTVKRKPLVKEVKQGKHPKFDVYKRGKEEFVRGVPDGQNGNNVNEE